ncbi:MAG: DUF2953 domain-containing protein [Lachnospiraceae bacterium]|nr:DUF2953 domain-containing protein [Lachnospiraceae bacterium]
MVILLTILKVIGIALLCVLGLLILAILAVLFVPVRYQIKFDFDREESRYNADVSITWFLHILKAYLTYSSSDSGGIDYGAKLFGRKVYPKDSEDEAIEESEIEDYSIQVNNEAEPVSSEMPKKEENSEVKAYVSESTDSIETEKEEKPERNIEDGLYANAADGEPYIEDDLESDTFEKTETLFEKIICRVRLIIEKISSALDNISHTISSLCDKIKNVYEKAEYYKSLWERPSTQRAYEHIKKELGWLLIKIKPKKILIDVCCGQEDPADTGKVYGLYCSFSPWIGDSVRFEPDFEKTVLNGNGSIKGNLRIYVLVLIAIRVYRDRDIKKTLKGIRRHG